jgi:hypothetical protein
MVLLTSKMAGRVNQSGISILALSNCATIHQTAFVGAGAEAWAPHPDAPGEIEFRREKCVRRQWPPGEPALVQAFPAGRTQGWLPQSRGNEEDEKKLQRKGLGVY